MSKTAQATEVPASAPEAVVKFAKGDFDLGIGMLLEVVRTTHPSVLKAATLILQGAQRE